MNIMDVRESHDWPGHMYLNFDVPCVLHEDIKIHHHPTDNHTDWICGENHILSNAWG